MSTHIVGLDHVQLAMPRGRENDARAFYRDLLGLRELPKPPSLAAGGGCWFAGEGLALHLGVEEPFHPARKAHPALRVADLEAAIRHLSQHGVVARPDESIPGVRRCFIDDPFGNRIEFVQAGDHLPTEPT